MITPIDAGKDSEDRSNRDKLDGCGRRSSLSSSLLCATVSLTLFPHPLTLKLAITRGADWGQDCIEIIHSSRLNLDLTLCILYAYYPRLS
jgi:hypothetical protein